MRNASTGVVFLLCAFAAGSVLADEWPEFRGPTGQGLASATSLPIEWSPTTNTAWRTDLPGLGWSSPVLTHGRAFLTTAVPADDKPDSAQSLRVLCVDVGSGKLLWNVEVFQQAAGVKIHGKNSHASATPITDGKTLFVHFGTHGTAAMDFDGNVLWKNQELKYAPQHGNGGSPVLVEGLLVVSCDGTDVQFVAALDQNSGAIRWRVPRTTKPDRGFSFGTPLVIDVDGRRQIVSSGSDAVFAYAPKDGREIWRVNFPGGYSVVPRPVFGGGMLFVCTGYNNPTLLAIRPQGAEGDVTETHVAWQLKKGAPHNPSPLFVGGAVYVVADNGVATCLEATTGKQNWQKRLGGNYSASPLYAAEKIYFQSEEGEGIVIAADPTEYRELGRNSVGERALASYAVDGSSLVVRSEHHLAKIELTRFE